MNFKLRPLVMSMGLLSLITLPVFAETNTDNVSTRTQALERQVQQLKREMAAMRGYSSSHHHKIDHKAKIKSKQMRTMRTSNPTGSVSPSELQPSAHDVKIVNEEAKESQASSNLIAGPQNLPQRGLQYLPIDLDVPGQSFVSTGPYIGVPLQYNGADLIVNTPSVNQDVALLNLRKNIIQRLRSMGLKDSDQHSHLLLSGVVEGQAIYRDIGGQPNSSDIDLTSAGLDAYILGPSSWTTALISLRYDNNIGAQEGSLSMNARTQNSRVFVDKAFIVVGDFTQSPFYGTLGQMYVPFGTYSTSMISSPITKLMFRTQERAVVLGFQQQRTCAFYGAAFGFRGDSHVGSTSRLNNGGFNLGYKFEQNFFKGNIGGGYIANIADSQGMQNNGMGAVYVPPATPIFGGFGAVAGTGNEQLVHRVAAWETRALLNVGKTVDIIAEYIASANSFSRADLTMNGHGARPQALNSEVAYTFQGLSIPVSISLGYGMSKDGLALGMPAQRWSTTINTSVWRNTLQSLEFRRDNNYASSATASGSNLPAASASGKSDNIITAQFDIFF